MRQNLKIRKSCKFDLLMPDGGVFDTYDTKKEADGAKKLLADVKPVPGPTITTGWDDKIPTKYQRKPRKRVKVKGRRKTKSRKSPLKKLKR